MSNTEFVIKSTDTFYNAPNILCHNNSNFLQIIYSEDFNIFMHVNLCIFLKILEIYFLTCLTI